MMKRKKVAFIRASSIYNDSRATKEITALIEANYDVYLIGWNRDGRAETKCIELFGNTVKYMSFFNVNAENGVGGKNIYKLLLWFTWLHKELRKIGNEIDIIHSCDFDTGVIASMYSSSKPIKIVYDIYDYYTDAHEIPSFIKAFIQRKENKIIDAADLTIICTEERKEQIEGTCPRKLSIIYNSPSLEEHEGNEEEIYDYVYCGSLCDKRLIKEILSAYPSNSDLVFCFAGYGEYSELAKELDASYDNFTYLGPISYKQVLSEEKKAKVLSAIYDPNIRNHRLCAPNKFYEALGLGKPIIVCKGTGIDTVVYKEKLGAVINYDACEFYQRLREIISNNTNKEVISNKGKKIFETQYDWIIMKNRLIDAYRAI